MSVMAAAELQCIICPKQPIFSDQSHLLTHISSKGHLSHFFKAQVRGSKDAATQQTLRAYNDWYRRNRIEKLLSQRLEIKESKKPPQHQRFSTPVPHKECPNRTDDECTPCPQPQARVTSTGHPCIDPDLDRIGPYDVAFEEEYPSTRAEGIASKLPFESPPMANMFQQSRSNGASGHGAATPQKEYEATQGLFDLKHAETYPWQGEYCLFPTPSYPYENYSAMELSESSLNYAEHGPPATHIRHASASSSILGDSSSEFHRLKGTIWPGMDLFDTADEESKRRRNQKKDKAALMQLATDADAIEPTEVIYFYPSWEVKKARFISGNVESSPIKDTSPTARQRKKGTRRPLGELDPNLSFKGPKYRGRRPTGKRTSTIRPRKGKRAAHESDDDILDLMQPFGPLSDNRKRAFRIFKDSSPDPKSKSPRHEEPTSQSQETLQENSVGLVLRPSLPTKDQLPTIQSYSPRSPRTFTGLVYSTPRPRGPGYDKHSPLSPPMHLRPSSDAYDLTLRQNITPQRVFLRSPARYGAPNRDSDFGTSLSLSRSYGHGQEVSPLGFSLSAVLAYAHDSPLGSSPLKRVQPRRSPSDRKTKAGRNEAIFNEISDEETIDLGMNGEFDPCFFR